MICILLSIFSNRDRADDFASSITGRMIGPIAVVAPFLFIALATALLCDDPNSFFNFFVDAFMPMLLMMYMTARVIAIEDMLKFLKIALIVVCISCYLDALVLHWNPYNLLHTISSVSGGSAFRAGAYRVAAMTSHPIALGIYFVLMTPLMCIDVEKERINVAKNWGLILMICGAVLLCGSRMPQVTFILEIIILFILTDKEEKRILVPYVLVFGTIAVSLIVLFHDEPHIRRYVILNVYQLIDSIFGTQLVLDEFGYWQWAYIQSWDYRNLLPLLFFSDEYSPLVGLGVTAANYSNFSADIGGRVVASIDNYYVLQYLQFAWPGLIAMLLVFAYMLKRCASGARKSIVCKLLLISFCLYFVNLWFVADLGTFKYAFSLFGLAYVYSKKEGLSQCKPVQSETLDRSSLVGRFNGNLDVNQHNYSQDVRRTGLGAEQ